MKPRRKHCRGISGLTIYGTVLMLVAAMPILAYGQTGVSRPASSSTPSAPSAPPPVPTLFGQMTIMPYLTASLNLFSGMAFPEPASGAGFGAGLSFDMTKQGQSAGLMFDFAFQDMTGYAANGMCLQSIGGGFTDSVAPSADAYHYWYYLLFEPYLKLQTKAKNGYFIIGASVGMAVFGETVSKAEGVTQFIDWDTSPFGNVFRLDIRAGIGVKLADIGKHELILEARAGYPLTSVISNFPNVCTAGTPGNWRIITMQANLGLRI